MKYIAAVSGGVDSVVLLDMLNQQGHEVIVAHFDHGIRPESSDDARFVAGLAARYGCKYVKKRVELGNSASEDAARKARYDFLFAQSKTYKARLVTAHHKDDLIETIAINLHRGTGWRGVAVLGRDDIERPLLETTKQEIYEYAILNSLEWVEDITNHTEKYLRNRMRRTIFSNLEVKKKEKLVKLRSKQLALRSECDKEIQRIISSYGMNRYFLTHVDEMLAIELLREIVWQKTGVSLTRPMLHRAVMAIKTAKPGSLHHIGDGVSFKILLQDFVVKTP